MRPPVPRSNLVRMPTSESDEDLITRARGGDESAYRRIIERHEGVVASTAIGLLGRGVEADEVGQETFVRCFRSLDRFRGESALASYLVTIARNLALSVLARRARNERRFVEWDGVEPMANEPATEPVDRADVGERRAMVERALGRLSDAHRAVVVLRLLQGLSTKETAEALSVPEGTVLSRLARASAQLRSMLSPYLSHGEAVEER
jgi:RNA polymerase sigma-70 factor, ECF subfamily